MQCAIFALLLVLAQAAIRERSAANSGAELQLRAQRVSPDVDKSDKKFFGKDYPWDKRPAADKYYVFDHPYPAVQDSGDFDRDFVKDENSDGGRWQAQMEYDTLRAKIRAAKEKLGELKGKMEKEYEEWMRAKDNDKRSAKTADEAGKVVDTKKEEADAAAKKVNELEGSSSQEGTKVGGAIGDAVKKVEHEMEDLEKCKKALADAKRRLKDLLKEKEEFEKRRAAAKAVKKAKKEKAEEEHKKAKAEHERKKKEAAAAGKKADEADEDDDDDKKHDDDDEDEDGFDEEAWHKKLEREKADHQQALEKYEKQLRDVKLTEDQLARAAENLRKFRRPPYVDADGGVYHAPKSLAFSARVPVAIMLVVFAACTAHL